MRTLFRERCYAVKADPRTAVDLADAGLRWPCCTRLAWTPARRASFRVAYSFDGSRSALDAEGVEHHRPGSAAVTPRHRGNTAHHRRLHAERYRFAVGDPATAAGVRFIRRATSAKGQPSRKPFDHCPASSRLMGRPMRKEPAHGQAGRTKSEIPLPRQAIYSRKKAAATARQAMSPPAASRCRQSSSYWNRDVCGLC
jgi:hypothetical protein